MAAKPVNPLWGLLSGAAVGTILCLEFSPPVAGPVLGVLVGMKILHLSDLREGLRAGLVMGASIGAGLILISLVQLFSSYEPDAWVNLSLAVITLHAFLGAAAGAAAGYMARWVQGQMFLL